MIIKPTKVTNQQLNTIDKLVKLRGEIESKKLASTLSFRINPIDKLSFRKARRLIEILENAPPRI